MADSHSAPASTTTKPATHLRRAAIEIRAAATNLHNPKHRELLLVAVNAFTEIAHDLIREKETHRRIEDEHPHPYPPPEA